MDFEKEREKNREYNHFVFLLVVMFFLTILVGMGLSFIVKWQNQSFYTVIFITGIMVLMTFCLILLSIIYSVIRLQYGYTIPSTFKKLLVQSRWGIYQSMVFLGKVFGKDKNIIRRVFIELNNKLTLSQEYSIEGNKILILTPHCIQKSFCPHKVTTNIKNCKRCGKCNVQRLIELEEKFGVKARVVTGGTLARKIVMEEKPQAIIAIACERDLISGIQEIKNVPILAVVNKRPQGPCHNTEVEMGQVQKAIKHFTNLKE